jgi:hypothetical protein
MDGETAVGGRSRRSLVRLMLLGLVAMLFAGCGSSQSSSSSTGSTSLPGGATSPDPSGSPVAPDTSSTSVAGPNTSGSPSFVVNTGTSDGDAVKIQGWFGPALPASESNVDQTTLSECGTDAGDGRAMVVALDLTVTLESSLAGEVELNLGSMSSEVLAEYIFGYSSGAQCTPAEVNPVTGIKLGRLQPHQSTTFPMWVVLINAITPNEPHPSEATLRHSNWLMALPHVTVDGESSVQPDAQPSANGPRVVQCTQSGYSVGEDTIAIIGGTAKAVQGQTCP